MKKVNLNMSENYKYEAIKSCYLKRLSKQGATTRLDIFYQTSQSINSKI